MKVEKEQIEFIRLLQNQRIHFCPDCHAPTQGTYVRDVKEIKYIFVLGCTKCSWGEGLEVNET
jgi:RNase P subunit RPR2